MNKNNPFSLFSDEQKYKKYVLIARKKLQLAALIDRLERYGQELYRELLLHYLVVTITLLTVVNFIPVSEKARFLLLTGILVIHFIAKKPVFSYLNVVRTKWYQNKIALLSEQLLGAVSRGTLDELLSDLNAQFLYYENNYNGFHSELFEKTEMSFHDYAGYYRQYSNEHTKVLAFLKEIIATHGRADGLGFFFYGQKLHNLYKKEKQNTSSCLRNKASLSELW